MAAISELTLIHFLWKMVTIHGNSFKGSIILFLYEWNVTSHDNEQCLEQN